MSGPAARENKNKIIIRVFPSRFSSCVISLIKVFDAILTDISVGFHMETLISLDGLTDTWNH